jgi:hypothetical protein
VLYRPKVLRLLPSYRRLMRDGRRAKAVILESRTWWGTAGSVALNARLRLKVHFDDGTGRTIDRVERYRDLVDQSAVGSILPMRYDGDRIEVDLPELRRRYQAWEAKLDRERIRDAEAKLKRKPPG